jgi:hypothetical protein
MLSVVLKVNILLLIKELVDEVTLPLARYLGGNR